MADLTKLKRKGTLGVPPPVTEASSNLEAPEIVPPEPATKRAPPVEVSAPPRREGRRERDGRSARRTGRTIQFATRVSLEFDERLRAIAERESLMLVEVLERALDAYEEHHLAGKS